jgi:16S rRNA (cytidine1402-2'-O)-methyltransferase
MPGTLYLIPSFLGHHSLELTHPPEVLRIIHKIEHFAVERLQSAVQFLSRSAHPIPEYKLQFHSLDKHVTPVQLNDIIGFLQKGNDVGVLSEAGCPGIADPGADLVWMCHLRGISVQPLVGPTAIILAMMSSGMNGQKFAFNGYLPIQAQEREFAIRQHTNRSSADNQTQIFIEAPVRNETLLEALIKQLPEDAKLAVCYNMLNEDQWIHSAPVRNWAGIKTPENFSKKPAMFLFHSAERQRYSEDDKRAASGGSARSGGKSTSGGPKSDGGRYSDKKSRGPKSRR